MTDPKLSDEIRQALLHTRLPIADVARLSGIEKRALLKFLASESGLSMDNLDSLAHLFGLHFPARKKAKEKASDEQCPVCGGSREALCPVCRGTGCPGCATPRNHVHTVCRQCRGTGVLSCGCDPPPEEK